MKAINGHTEKINLYAQKAQTAEAQNFAEGWHNAENITGAQSLGPEADMLEFSDENSAFYTKGDYSLIASDFNFLSADIESLLNNESENITEDKKAETDFESEYDIAAEAVFENEIEAEAEARANEAEIEPSAKTEEPEAPTETEVEAESLMPAAIDAEAISADALTTENNFLEETQNENTNSAIPTEPEIYIEELENIENEILIENIPEAENGAAVIGTDAGDGLSAEQEISLLEKIKGIFAKAAVNAQSLLSPEIKTFSDLGKFKSATINFSLAFNSRPRGINDNVEMISGGDMDMPSDSPTIDAKDAEAVSPINAEDTQALSPTVSAEANQEALAETEEMESGQEASAMENNIEETVELISGADNEQNVEIISDSPNTADSEQEEISLQNFWQAVLGAESAQAAGAEQGIIIWYSLAGGEEDGTADERLWQKLDEIRTDNISNYLNKGYFAFDAPFLKDWADIENLQIKIEARDKEQEILFYLDSVWVEAVFERETELDKLKKRQRWEQALKVLSEKSVLKFGKNNELKFQYVKNEEHIWETLGEIFGINNFWKNVEITIALVDPKGRETDAGLTAIFADDGTFTIYLPENTQLSPGRYYLKFSITDESGEESEEFTLTHEFYWGVLAMNFDQSVYAPAENAYVQMAVLDDLGHTICDAEVKLRVADPNGSEQEFSTAASGAAQIFISGECGPETVTNMPDYYFHYQFAGKGEYEFMLTAKTAAGEKTIAETIEVKDQGALTIKRSGPTRIWPKADYDMRLEIAVLAEFNGSISEQIPANFKIINSELQIKNNELATSDKDMGAEDGYAENLEPAYKIIENEAGKEIIWENIKAQAGAVIEIMYRFDAPDLSPELFLLGPLAIKNNADEILWEESRQWQIASDALMKRARTVIFQAGVYNGSGTAGQNTNTDYALDAFNWRLAESGASIKSAYVVMETQFEAYNTTGGAYTGYKLGFDACVESCTASAFGASAGQVLDNNSNTLVYDDTESNRLRLLLDVTQEAQIAAYTGNNVLMQSQFGYHLKNASTHSSIANASAILVITYTYDIDAENLTNTVAYPLNSTSGADSGSRQVANSACTADSDCPTFEYTMALAEWSGAATSTNRVSQWFKMFGAPQGNTTSDFRPYLDIQSYNVDSSPFHYEEALSGNGNTPPMYFPDWANSGYAENQTQQTELYINAPNYVLGGEVYETYIASSSAPVKTRTVALPLGVITNGNTTGGNSQSATVYFPENGNATGTVKIKSAWVRIVAHGHTASNRTYNAVVSTKTGDNAVSGNYTYQYRAPVAVVSPAINIIHIIAPENYAELEEANAGTGKTVQVNLSYSNAAFNGASAELMITYTYANEGSGYLTSLKLFGGQASAAPAISATIGTANSVFPETAGKTVLAAGLYASFLTSNSAGNMNTTVHLSDANLSADTPDCSLPAYRALPDSVNMYAEMIKDVSAVLTGQDNQAYTACYASDNSGLATDGAKHNGQLAYTYSWTNSPPISAFNSAVFRTDGSNIVDLEIEAMDADYHDTRVKIEYATGTDCVFSSSAAPRLDESDANITADFGDPYIENDNQYQIGTENGYIKTASGSNSLAFDWLAAETISGIEGAYCLQITANDMHLDQEQPATTTVYIDTKKPSAPGALGLHARTGTSITLNFGATTTETNFYEYRIYYKQADGTDPDEDDLMWASSSDMNLFDKFFNDQATTTINVGLAASTTYSFAIWAYDIYGNKASSTRTDITTNDAPTGIFNQNLTKQKSDGTGSADIAIKADDLNDQNNLKAKIEYVPGADCDFTDPQRPSLDENQENISADFGAPALNNSNEYQIGNASGWIMTSPGENNIHFDWLAKSDLPDIEGVYCLRLTVNDGFDNQLQAATATVIIDNLPPLAAGSLTAGSTTVDSISLLYDSLAPGQDANPPLANAYRIYYKQGESGVSEGESGESEIDNADLDAYDYKSATSTLVSGLMEDTWYVFKIWTYDAYGNKASSSETAIKTAAAISHQSFAFTNAYAEGENTNIAAALPSEEWNFRAVITNINGWYAISSTTLRLADNSDNSAPYDDLVFKWNQSGEVFSEIGNDAQNAAALSVNSTSTCADLSCTINFRIIFNKSFTDTNTNYAATLTSDTDSGVTIENSYANFYQVRFPYIEQIHYRWRNDDGGE